MATAQAGGGSGIAIYRPSRGLRYVLMATFFLLVLFIVNAAVGSVWLASNQLWTDAIIFLILFFVGGGMLLFAGLFLFSASHTLVRLDNEKCVAVLPNWRGPTPMFPYTEIEIPFRDIAAVEKRGEVYRYYLLPVLVEAASFVRRDGRRFTLGYIRKNATEHAVPYHEIADEIGRRAGVGVSYKGVVQGGARLRAIVQDEPPWDAQPLGEEEVEQLRAREDRIWKSALVGLALLIGGGLLFQGVRLMNVQTGSAAPAHPAANR